MRVLLLTPYPAYPPHGGGVQRMYQFVRHLSQRHEVWCLSLSPNAAASAAAHPLARWCNLTLVPAPHRSILGRAITTFASPLPDMALRAPSRAFRQALDALLDRIRFDVVQAESIEMAQYGLHAQRRGVLATLDQFNAEYVLQRRAALTDVRHPRRAHAALYSLIQWRKLARYERHVCNRLDQVYVVSAQDATALRQIGVDSPLPIVPNGVDTEFFTPPPEPQSKSDLLLFTGTLDFRPNIDALIWFVRDVLPIIQRQRPGTRLRIVGRSPAPAVQALAQNANVELAANVPDVRPHFAAAAVYVLPMRIGGGVRLKLLEALAMATPLVSTTMGADGVEGLHADEHCLLADDPHAFAAAVVRILTDRALAQRLAAQGRAFVAQHYDWHAIVPRLEAAWTSFL